MIPYDPVSSPSVTTVQAQAPDHKQVDSAADRVLDAGDRDFMKDNYEKRMDVFAKEISGQSREFQAELINTILDRDGGAFKSWMHSDRLNWMTSDGDISQHEKSEVYAAFAEGIDRGQIDAGKIDAGFVRGSQNPGLIGQYMDAQNLNDNSGFRRAMVAFSGLSSCEMQTFITNDANQALMQRFEKAVQGHQDWYESLVNDYVASGGGYAKVYEGEVEFSKEQLISMRSAFLADDGLHTSGELLLAYPDRMERNERVTEQYHELSTGMSEILGKDNANWATFAQWASDEIGRNLDGTLGIALGEMGGNPKYWLSVGNTMLSSDISPSFKHFVDTFGGGKNRDMSFEQFWSGFENKYAGRELTYTDGRDTQLDMKNAFKAYYDSMKLKDGEAAITDPAQLADSKDHRGELMLYANSLIGLQEQDIINKDISNGMRGFGIVNPGGFGEHWIDLHVPDRDGKGGREINLNLDMKNSDNRVNFDSGREFVTADGRTIKLGDEVRTRLNGLDGNPNNEDETDINNADTNHWESYSQRMGTIYHLFANSQRDGELFLDARDVFDSRAKDLNNNPWRS